MIFTQGQLFPRISKMQSALIDWRLIHAAIDSMWRGGWGSCAWKGKFNQQELCICRIANDDFVFRHGR